jgi:predicted transcriptional regulator
VQDPDTLPVFEVKRPKSEQLLVLGMLGDNSGRMRKARIIEGLESAGVIRLKDETKTEFTPAAKHSQLRAILDPMETEWGFINVESSGRRSEVFLTDKGNTALRIFGVSPS